MTSPAGHYPGASLTVWSTSTPPGLLNRTRVSDGQQVGSGALPGFVNHALLWTGSADSVVDLQTFLPPEFRDSVATGIDADANIVGYAQGPDGDHAFLLIPE